MISCLPTWSNIVSLVIYSKYKLLGILFDPLIVTLGYLYQKQRYTGAKHLLLQRGIGLIVDNLDLVDFVKITSEYGLLRLSVGVVLVFFLWDGPLLLLLIGLRQLLCELY